ncbi:transposase family protein [Frankia sp. Cas4]|uniref:transposase family protein n=1 Tax=Frankia sp. Cas4 TaxID=3073927 RepID=UPI003A0FBB50
MYGRGRATAAACPGCGVDSEWVHSRYEWRIMDCPASNQELVVHLRVRRFFYDVTGCARRTFAEQVPRLTALRSRCTPLLRRAAPHLARAPASSVHP